jgi:predicted secreted hydrolase
MEGRMQKAERRKVRWGAGLLCAFCLLNSAFAYEFEFPRDHGTHDDYATEWWYYTGHLTTEDNHRYGFELTFFRVRVAPAASAAEGGATQATEWDLRHLALAHFAITDVDGKQFRYYEKLNRASKFTADAAAGHLDVFSEGWRATTAPDGSWRIVAADGKDSIDLSLRSLKPPAIHVEHTLSNYYSMTCLEAAGMINGHRARGQAWMDHEFGSTALRENQRGWDWYSVQLDNDTELMLYVIRGVEASGSLITSDGHVIPIRSDQMQIRTARRWHSKKSGGTYPLQWSIAIPSLRISLALDPLLDDQELVTKQSTRVTYWEGAVDVQGSFDGVAVRGAGYVEMTGYAR